jgi:transketolase
MKKYTNTGSKDTRSGFGGKTELGQKRNVVALCADLIGSLKFDDFKPPERFFQIGIAET